MSTANDAGNVVNGPWPSNEDRQVCVVNGLLAKGRNELVSAVIAGKTVDGSDFFECSPAGLDDTIRLLQDALRFLQRMK